MSYIYEHIRCRGYRPLLLDEHYANLEATARACFDTTLNFSREKLQRQIEKCLREASLSPAVTNGVEVQYRTDGTMCCVAKELLYDNFAVRSLRPRGYVTRILGDIVLQNTSVKRAMVKFTHDTKQSEERCEAIWLSENDEVIAIDGEAVIVVFEEEIRFSQSINSVEMDLAFRAAMDLGYNVVTGPIFVGELEDAKEILHIGYEGITALFHFNDKIYLNLTARKIAERINNTLPSSPSFR